MRSSDELVEKLKEWEGFRPSPYICAGGKFTNGFGNTRNVTKDTAPVTRKQAEQDLRNNLKDAEDAVSRLVSVPLSQGQFDALVSFVFNVGVGKKGIKDGFGILKNGNPSTMLKLINNGYYRLAAQEFAKWRLVNGKPSNGIIKRREAEKQLFLKENI